MDKVSVQPSRIEGLGLFAVVTIRAGEPIFETTDDGGADAQTHVVMTDEDFREHIKTVDGYSATAIGDGLHRESLIRTDVDYGNHSCEPNVCLAATDNSHLVALREIAIGEEVNPTMSSGPTPRTGEWSALAGLRYGTPDRTHLGHMPTQTSAKQ